MPSGMARKLGTTLAVAALSGGAVAVAAAPAHAAPRTPVPYYNCTYPYVCLYNQVVDTVLKYRDFTTGWQSFSRTDVYFAVNTRNDDTAYIRYTNGDTACIPSGNPRAIYDLREFGTPNGIRIDTNPNCPTNMSRPSLSKQSN
ncbi:MAG: hypothetical protein JWP48_7315 [Actinoallomurus sp.]|jgi:hypothetical protein|nr:hypothetical protein [Actinoallomurus sp.]